MADGIQGNATSAAMAFRSATEDAGNFIDNLMYQYGWTMPGPDGSYSTVAAGDAFDPNNIMQFGQDGHATMDMAKIAHQTAGGQMGGKGIFSDIMRGGGAQEAQAISEARGRGIAQGGLAQQARQLAENLTTQKSGKASEELFNAIYGQYGNVRGAYGNLTQQQVLDLLTSGQNQSNTIGGGA